MPNSTSDLNEESEKNSNLRNNINSTNLNSSLGSSGISSDSGIRASNDGRGTGSCGESSSTTTSPTTTERGGGGDDCGNDDGDGAEGNENDDVRAGSCISNNKKIGNGGIYKNSANDVKNSGLRNDIDDVNHKGRSKKYRHQNFSKNIYIGTKNAEKWDITRQRLAFKNDVEFVTYLLKLADYDTERYQSFQELPSTKNSFDNFKLEPNLSAKNFENNISENDYIPQSTKIKSTKRVQFQDSLNTFIKSKSSTLSSKHQDKSISSTASIASKDHKGSDNDDDDDSNEEDDDEDDDDDVDGDDDENGNDIESHTPEVLDCRIAEKIKNELEQKTLNNNCNQYVNNINKNALCLKKPKKIFPFDKKEENTHRTKTENDNDSYNEDEIENSEGLNDQSFRMRDRSHLKKLETIKKSLFNERSNEANSSISGRDSGRFEKPNSISNKSDVDSDEDDGSQFCDEDDDADEIIDDVSYEKRVRLKQSCRGCTFAHEFDDCPFQKPLEYIKDSIDLSIWNEQKINFEKIQRNNKPNDDKTSSPTLQFRQTNENCDRNDEDDSTQSSITQNSSSIYNNKKEQINQIHEKLQSFSEATLPQQFELRKLVESEDVGVFAKINVPKYTRLGPLLGDVVQINDISEDCNMKNIFEIHDGTTSIFISTANFQTSNWLRYIRPAKCYKECNINLVCIEKKAYFVTCDDIQIGCELLYWSDECNSSWQKKYTEKTSCGGCNIKFEHPLYYRTHCSIFHDASFSLTIRKYHCKICGEAVLGKENIMKHAEQMHDGKGAYQCQFCKKFFLRLNYLEMHRTYGCSANPQRTRPLCDFCGRKFCQPQKLKVHIKRMHSDMAEVLRDFQCKLCSKLLGSRAALQRHSKEVHSRNSAVVSCPRCQKLFQNRSNLKIHMLTHSGVRPFKCAESDCTAAFTTKQCLQFHYKKVHNYSQEQMPKIERSVAYTFDAYSGGMKIDFLEQAPRRRRKSLEDQNSLLSSSMMDSKSETDFSDDNIFDNMKKSGKSIKDLCRSETNLSLLSTKLTSLFNKECNGEMTMDLNNKRNEKKRRRKSNKTTNLNSNKVIVNNDEDDSLDEQQCLELAKRKQQQQQQQQHHNAAQLSLVESFLSTQAQRLGTSLAAATTAQVAAVAAVAAATVTNELLDEQQKLHDDDDDDEELPHNDKTDNNIRHHMSNSKDSLNNLCQNLVVSKGSKKWISDNDSHNLRNDTNNHYGRSNEDNSSLNVPTNDEIASKILPNRDFIARFMMNNVVEDQNHISTQEEDENSSFLDVVDSNNHGGHVSHFQENNEPPTQLHMNPLTHPQSFINTFYNNVNSRLTAGGTTSTSASMLVEAALNSVGNMMENDEINKCQGNSSIENNQNSCAHVDVDTSRFENSMNNIDNLENEIKMMKNLNQFQMQIPPLPMFQNTGNNLSSCNLSPDTSTNQPNNGGNSNSTRNNDIDVDSGSTPRGQNIGNVGDSDVISKHHQASPSPQIISPGRDYSLFNSSNSATNSGGGGTNNISSSSPLPSIQGRSGAISNEGNGSYPEHELISPASSPAIPRYSFSNEMCRKREQENRSHNINAQSQLSSDEENSIIAQNSTNSAEELRMKFTQSQMDLMYSKYENIPHSNSLKYNNDQDLDVADFRTNTANDLSDLQGLDMTSRSNIGSTNYHHNFQLPSTSSSNLGLGRYHHHIYDILSEREQQQQQQQQQQAQQSQQDHSNQLSMQHQQSLHGMLPNQMSDQDHDQATSVDLSRTANYASAISPPPHISYPHSHHDMLRMVSLDLTSNTNMGVGNNRSFLPSQMTHNTRDSLDHHRLLSTAEQHRILAASNAEQHRLLVDPATHLLMEQNNRLLNSDQRLLADTPQNRHGVVPTRGFGAYHHHQVASNNYHHAVRPVLPSPNHHTPNPSNYHPFPAYY